VDTPRERVQCGVTYWSSEVGPYVWHEFDTERTAAELRGISAAGFRVLRTLLPWDAFMPTPRGVDQARMRDLEVLLTVAAAESLEVIPVLFVQSFGDCVMLPGYAIDVDHPRRGVRVLTGGVVQPGGPRDIYTEPRMLEPALLWLEQMLAAFAGHPSISMWDLGSDPASTVRPRRIAHLHDWVAAMAVQLRERDGRGTLTMGSRDVTTARGVRIGPVAQELGRAGIEVDPGGVPLGDAALDPSVTRFVAQLGQRLAGDDAELSIHVGDSPQADAFSGLVEVGCAGVHATQWSNCGARVSGVPPFDRAPGLCERGVVDSTGELTAFGRVWSANARVEHERRARSPWPARLDVDTYYANLPDSLHDLYAAWRRETDDHPGMLV